MLFKSKDGELRIYDRQTATSRFYMTALFTDANLSFPLGRPRVDETLNMDRGKASASMCYSQGPDDPIFAPLDFSMSCKLDDQSNVSAFQEILSGNTKVAGSKTLLSTKGSSSIYVRTSAVTTLPFADSSKTAYNVEVLWDGADDIGYQIREVYFPPNRQTISEGADAVTMNISGLIYGDVSPIVSFTSGTTLARITP